MTYTLKFLFFAVVTDTSKFSMYAEVLSKTLSAGEIKEKVNSLLSSNTIEYSLESGKQPSVIAVLGKYL